MDIQRRLVSYKTLNSWENVPHVVFNYEGDITILFEFYQELKDYFKQKYDVRLTMNILLIKIISEALKKAPKMNASFTFDKEKFDGNFIIKEDIDIDIPWILPNNKMLTVTLPETQNKSLLELIQEFNSISSKIENTNIDELYLELVNDIKNNNMHSEDDLRLTPLNISKGSITVSNIGSICNSNCHFTLLDVLSPQVVTIGISSAQYKPTVVLDENSNQNISIRKILPICIAFDHRVLDFGDIIPFLNYLDNFFANAHVIKEWI